MTTVEARPSASVVVLRDSPQGPEFLLVQRNANISFHGGSWVFPGGKVDPVDHENAQSDNPQAVAATTAVREAHEETGVALQPTSLQVFSHWTTPEGMPKRFATWFFLAVAPESIEVTVDRSEIVDHQWQTSAGALALQAQGEVDLPPPTFVTLTKLRAFDTVTEIFDQYQRPDADYYAPRIVNLEDGRCALYQEDAGYETTDMSVAGARHRLVMRDSGWHYHNEF